MQNVRWGGMSVRHLCSANLPDHFKIKLPALSPTMESGTLVQWLKKEGDSVSEGEPLCEIQTDKATMTFESPEDGFVAKILMPSHSKDIPVGKLIAVIVPENESLSAFQNYTPDESASSAPETSTAPGTAPTSESSPPSSTAASKSYPDHFKIKMPSLSPTMESGTLVNWVKKEGDEVSEGDVLCEIQTDKATMAFEAPESGFVAKILVPNNTANIPVGKLICVITEESGNVGAFADFVDSGSTDAAPKRAAPEQPKAVEQAVPPPVSTPTQQIGTFTTGSVSDMPSHLPFPGQKQITASPLARTIAHERGVDLNRVKGSGPSGLVTSADVLANLDKKTVGAPAQQKETAKPQQVGHAQATPQGVPIDGPASYVDIPITNMRSVIAKRLVQSKQTIPHYYLTVDVEIDSVMKLRKELNTVLEKQAAKSGEKPQKLSVNDFIVKAASLACKKVPECNSAWLETQGVIRKYSNVDVSVAVATDNGLITPIVFGADTKGLSEIGNNVATLAKKAREGRLQLNEFQGGTFTISNLGMFGIREFSAVINPPQACILAVGGAVARLVPTGKSGEGEQQFRQISSMSVTLSCDHRVVDGAVGAQWLAEFRRLMESPTLMLL